MSHAVPSPGDREDDRPSIDDITAALGGISRRLEDMILVIATRAQPDTAKLCALDRTVQQLLRRVIELESRVGINTDRLARVEDQAAPANPSLIDTTLIRKATP